MIELTIVTKVKQGLQSCSEIYGPLLVSSACDNIQVIDSSLLGFHFY